MGIKIASMFAEIGADTTKLEEGLERTQDGLEKTAKKSKGLGLSLTDLKSGIDLASQAISAVVDTAQQIYEIGRAGAELQYTEEKFARLALAAGTTAEVLMGDLREATKGTYSDAQLMASAGDLMSLGLVKTHDDVVRLSTVMGGLGMDMNQLVLTLANKTTMRFDQLGVSVDGFDERLKELKDSGMDVNAAFTEAFLRQAEEQLEKVGNKANEAIGTFQRFETRIANTKSEVQKFVSDAIEPLIKAELDLQDAMDAGYGKQLKMIPQQARVSKVIEETVYAYQEEVEAMAHLTEAEERARDAARRNAEGHQITAEALQASRDAAMQAAEAFDAASGYTSQFDQSVRTLNAGLSLTELHALEVRDAYQAYKDAQTELTQTQENYEQGVGGEMARLFADAELSGDDYKTVLGLIDEVTGTTLLKQQEQKEEMEALIDLYKSDGPQAFKDGLQGIIDKFSPFDESIKKSTELLDILLDKYSSLVSKDVHIRMFVEEINLTSAKYWPEDEEESYRASGGTVWSGRPYIVGEQGPELFIPDQSGQVIPAGDTAQMMGGMTINTLNITLPGVTNAPQFARELDRLARAQRAGMQYAG